MHTYILRSMDDFHPLTPQEVIMMLMMPEDIKALTYLAVRFMTYEEYKAMDMWSNTEETLLMGYHIGTYLVEHEKRCDTCGHVITKVGLCISCNPLTGVVHKN